MAEHYFTSHPHSPAVEREIHYTARGHDFVASLSDGVFSAHDLDKGTRVLLDKAPCRDGEEGSKNDLPYPRLCVDVGCGWGPLTLALAKEYPRSHVLAVDVNERALYLTEKNAQKNGCTNLITEQADQALARLNAEAQTSQSLMASSQGNSHEKGGSEKTAATHNGQNAGIIDLIWSNPPIRIGKKDLHRLLVSWLNLLRPGTGRAYWVVHKNLGADSLTAWLTANGYPSKKIASQKGYRVIESAVPLER